MDKLTPRLLYSKNFSSKYGGKGPKKYGGKGPKEFYQKKGGKDYTPLNKQTVITNNYVRSLQMLRIKSINNKNKAEMGEYIKMLNLNIDSDIGLERFDENFLSGFRNLEKIIGTFLTDEETSETNLRKILMSLRKTKQLEVGEYNKLKIEFQNIFDKIKNRENDETIIKEVKLIENKINEIDIIIANQGTDVIPISAFNTLSNKGKQTTLFGQLMGLSKRLKGRQLELKAYEFLLNKISQTSSKLKVLDSANLTEQHPNILGELGPKGRMSKTDILITIQNTLEEIEKLKEEKVISEQSDISRIIAGVQVKSGINQKPFNDYPVSWMQLIQLNKGSNHEIYITLLNSLLNEPMAKYHMYTIDQNMEKPIYNPLFNLSLIRGLQRIIGEKNSLIVTRDGVGFMTDYLLTRMAEGNLIKVKEYANITNMNKMYNVTFGKE